MRQFHGTMSRRDFMKNLGLAGAGIGAAASFPAFHDIDELTVLSANNPKRPWWIRERDQDNPTTEVDWNIYKPYDQRNFRAGEYTSTWNGTLEKIGEIYGTTDKNKLNARWINDNVPGSTLKDLALSNAVAAAPRASNTFLGPSVSTPTQMGVANWTGSPEENFKMIQVASRYLGAWKVSALEITDKSRRMFYANDGDRDLVFDDVDTPSQTNTSYIIPNKFRWALNIMHRQPESSARTAPGHLMGSSLIYHNYTSANVSHRIQAFIKGLGYSALDVPSASCGLSIMSGLGENGRAGFAITPENGPMMRISSTFITDLPLSPTFPIDAGLNRFCYDCRKCADHCPTQSIMSQREPGWDITGPWNSEGIRTWAFNNPKCDPIRKAYAPGYCSICQSVCVFTKFDEAIIHDVVKFTASTTGIFNGFFRNMDDMFGYAKNSGYLQAHTEDDYPQQWWDTIGPEYGLHQY